jgi:hypothetical protein
MEAMMQETVPDVVKRRYIDRNVCIKQVREERKIPIKAYM